MGIEPIWQFICWPKIVAYVYFVDDHQRQTTFYGCVRQSRKIRSLIYPHESSPQWKLFLRKSLSSAACGETNKSNGVRTIYAISLKLVPLYRTSTCSFELLPLKSSSDSHTFLFQTLVYRNFGQKRRFCAISTRV